MFNWEVAEIAEIVSGQSFCSEELSINSILIDSRSSAIHPNTIFIALKGPNHNGHDYIHDLIQKGVRAFIVDEEITDFPNHLCLIKTNNCLVALQKLASHHRKSFIGQVIGITGSNGKTIVKEWLGSVLSGTFKISKSPKSYNSQVGVALSILQSNPLSEIHIIEAGISEPGEMENLEEMIKPDIGLITNIGDAHQESFRTRDQKLSEKLILFQYSKAIYYCSDQALIHSKIQEQFSASNYTLSPWSDTSFKINTKFSDRASLENLSHVFHIASNLGIPTETINRRISSLEPVAMRMEQKQGINGCTLINDYYNSDFQSIQNAIDLLWQQTPQVKKSLIISDILQSGESDDRIIDRLKSILKDKNFHRIIGIGKVMHEHGNAEFFTETFHDTKNFLDSREQWNFKNEAILLKAARDFQFEKISTWLEEKVHRTVLKINMPTLRHNLNLYRTSLEPDIKIMCMVKAMSYGSGTHEIARFLAHQNVDYLAVAFLDEGIKLRQAGVMTPIMVMNPDYSQVETLLHNNLEPEIFNLSGLRKLINQLSDQGIKNYPVHIKLDTGMHRLGIGLNDIDSVISELSNHRIKIASLFSHLAASGDPKHDKFTQQQIETFNNACQIITSQLEYEPLKHILNTAGIDRFPEARFNMVRLGIGLYGFGSELLAGLESPLVFQSYISQIHHIKKDETIGYDRSEAMDEDGKIGVIPVGYADGFDRRLGNGNWSVQVGDHLNIKTIGQICMDMCMIDLSHTNAKEGDTVTILKGKSGINDMAKKLETIPYEILTSFSSRITRVYEFE